MLFLLRMVSVERAVFSLAVSNTDLEQQFSALEKLHSKNDLVKIT